MSSSRGKSFVKDVNAGSGRAHSGFHRVDSAVAQREVARQRRHAINSLVLCLVRRRRHFESPAAARTSKVQEDLMASLTLPLFRDNRRASPDTVAIRRQIVRSRAGHYSWTETDVEDRPELAVEYNVRTTPTILLVKNGDIIDLIVGTPTTSLVHNLLDTRMLHDTGVTPSASRHTPIPHIWTPRLLS